jgi:23S rRNA (cytosine1962-C5)-methyltransferase
MSQTNSLPGLSLLASPDWADYELLDSGNGQKLERYGDFTFVRPEPQAMWQPALPKKRWKAAHGVFLPTAEESGGHWQINKMVPPAWEMRYKGLTFQAQTTAGRHLGVFPEQAAQWDWISGLIGGAGRQVQVLNLFGYTGLATLAAAQAGAKVTHVDASKKSVAWARQNQTLSGLGDRPVRWIVEDALKYVQREARRGNRYEGLILDPPKFGRGPQGEVWEFFDLLPVLLKECRTVLSPQLLFVALTAYAIRASAVSLYYALQAMLAGFQGELSAGELSLTERSAGRALSMAIYARWETLETVNKTENY